MAQDKAILIDTSKCMACRGCQVSCKQWNELPAEDPSTWKCLGTYQNPFDLSPVTYTLVKFTEADTDGKLRWLFRKHQCMHCTEAACLKVCPVGAAQRSPLGFVVIDQEKCIGCGMCEANCPFGVPHVNRKLSAPKARKCRACIDRLTNGMMPACVKTCPTGALSYGDRNDMVKSAYARVKELRSRYPRACIYGDKELGGLHILTVLTEMYETYDLPVNPKISENIQMLEELYKFVGIGNMNKDSILELLARWADEKGIKTTTG